MTNTAPRLTLGQPAPDVTLVDIHNQPVQLAGFWANGPTLLNFLRHYG